jgi:outer membrane lipoprotein SlyB
MIAVLLLLCLVACNYSTQTRYNYAEVGQAQVVEFGTVIAVRDIDVVAENGVAGGLAGGAGGAAVGVSTGAGFGQVTGGVAGAVVGAALGAAIEQAARNHAGIEYTVTLRNGKTVTLAQNISDKDVVHKVGDRVMVQANGPYQRVLPAGDLPTEINRPKGITVKDE